jgi:hypothetical protein
MRLPPPRSFPLRYAAAAVVLIFAVAASWIFFRGSSPSSIPKNLTTAVLTPGLVREGGQTNRIVVPSGDSALRLVLALPNDQHTSYRAQLFDLDGREIATRTDLKSETVDEWRGLVFALETDRLPAGDYLVKVSGSSTTGDSWESLSSYSFRLIKTSN